MVQGLMDPRIKQIPGEEVMEEVMNTMKNGSALLAGFAVSLLVIGCSDGPTTPTEQDLGLAFSMGDGHPVVLIIDEESIDNGNPPNFFSAADVNDDMADIGLRDELPYFDGHEGDKITLHTGQVGDEGWFALTAIPTPTTSELPWGATAAVGLTNYFAADEDAGFGDKEDLLDKIPGVTPLRATGLALLEGERVCAVVYDSDVSINYDPLDGSLKGDNLGIVAFEVVSVTDRMDGSSSSLPKVEIEILNADAVCVDLALFTKAPAPSSSSDPPDEEDVEVQAEVGLRTPLPSFAGMHIGHSTTLRTGQVGDEGWFALTEIPDDWNDAGPTDDGLINYLRAGPGLGSEDANGDREALLDKILGVTPLRAIGLKALEGVEVCAVVYDSDISINYDPVSGSLKGANLGIVAFEVALLGVNERTDDSSSSLPDVEITVLDAEAVCNGPLALFTGAPVPMSSSEPFDVVPPDPGTPLSGPVFLVIDEESIHAGILTP